MYVCYSTNISDCFICSNIGTFFSKLGFSMFVPFLLDQNFILFITCAYILRKILRIHLTFFALREALMSIKVD